MPTTNDYYRALGRSVWEFTGLEWGIACILRKLWPDYVARRYRLPEKPTAGRVAKDLAKAVLSVKSHQLKTDLENLRKQFDACIDKRNDLLHATPATVDDEQILTRMTERSSLHWKMQDLFDVADQFASAGHTANKVLYSETLKQHGEIGPWQE